MKAAPTKREDVANIRRKRGFLKMGCLKNRRGSLGLVPLNSFGAKADPAFGKVTGYASATIVEMEGSER